MKKKCYESFDMDSRDEGSDYDGQSSVFSLSGIDHHNDGILNPDSASSEVRYFQKTMCVCVRERECVFVRETGVFVCVCV